MDCFLEFSGKSPELELRDLTRKLNTLSDARVVEDQSLSVRVDKQEYVIYIILADPLAYAYTPCPNSPSRLTHNLKVCPTPAHSFNRYVGI